MLNVEAKGERNSEDFTGEGGGGVRRSPQQRLRQCVRAKVNGASHLAAVAFPHSTAASRLLPRADSLQAGTPTALIAGRADRGRGPTGGGLVRGCRRHGVETGVLCIGSALPFGAPEKSIDSAPHRARFSARGVKRGERRAGGRVNLQGAENPLGVGGAGARRSADQFFVTLREAPPAGAWLSAAGGPGPGPAPWEYGQALQQVLKYFVPPTNTGMRPFARAFSRAHWASASHWPTE